MNTSSPSPIEALLDHAWVARAAMGDVGDGAHGVLLLPTDTGVAALRQQGRSAYVQALGEHLATQGLVRPAQWRLCDSWPAEAGARWASTQLAQPRPTEPTVLAEQMDADQAALTLYLPLDMIFFEVHFPRLPVLPGIVQVAWALAQGARRFATPAACRRVEMLKFQRPLRPGDHVVLALRVDRAQHRLHFAYTHGDVEYSSGRLCWKRDDA